MKTRLLGIIAILVTAGLITWGVLSSGSVSIPGWTPPSDASETGSSSDASEDGDSHDAGEASDSLGEQNEGEQAEPRVIENILQSDLVGFGYGNVTFLVIQTEEEWEALWSMAGGDPPTVDFESYTVLVALLGLRHSGGYSIEIEAVNESPEGVVVQVEATGPGPKCSTTAVITFPAHIVKIPKADGPFHFNLGQSTYGCDE